MRTSSEMIKYCTTNDLFYIDNSTVRPIYIYNFNSIEKYLNQNEYVKVAFTGTLEGFQHYTKNTEKDIKLTTAFALTNKRFICDRKSEFMHQINSISIKKVKTISLTNGMKHSYIEIECDVDTFSIKVHSDVATKLYDLIHFYVKSYNTQNFDDNKQIVESKQTVEINENLTSLMN